MSSANWFDRFPGRESIRLAASRSFFGSLSMRAIAIALVLGCAVNASADSRLPNPADVKELSVHPTALALKGADDAPQLIVTGVLNSGRLIDLTGDAEYTVAGGNVEVQKSGRVTPKANGAGQIAIRALGKSAMVPVTTTLVGENLPINFANQVNPIFTKLGCNSGGCHGKLSGQNGFRLSLLGFEPELDYMTLVKEGRGRRLFPSAPERSLLLMKGTGQMAHGGGRKMDPASEEYKIVRRWIAAGSPLGSDSDPTVTRVSIFPAQRVIGKQDRQQVAVYAHYSDGSVEDITRRAQYESNEPEIAKPDENGLVSTFDLTGQAAIMARYQGHVCVSQVVVPLGVAAPAWTFGENNFIDRLAAKKWRELGIAPSAPCSDETFIRRVSIDISGTLPTPEQVTSFLADADPNKRSKLVDRLLETSEYSYYFANKWADILRVKRGRNDQAIRALGTFAFHGWIRDAIAVDKPYDDFVREIVGALGDELKNPPAVWHKDLTTAEQFVDNASQVFLGLRLACANCHHHPYEKWGQDDYWGLAAFYGRVRMKTIPVPGQLSQGQQNGRLIIYNSNNNNAINKRTGKAAVMKTLDGDAAALPTASDPRLALIDWMVDGKNPFFARAIANRYWAHFMGRGIVDPLDDMRVTNPPSNPELLDALAAHLVENQFSLKQLIRTICGSKVYQLSAEPTEFNQHDKQSYARYYPKRLSAEVLFDAVSQATGSKAEFSGMPRDRYSPNRAIMLPDESYSSYFLDVFGRPQRLSACECERVSEANLAQTLHLLNSDEVQNKVANGSRLATLITDARPDAEKVDELFLWCWGKKPSAIQAKLALENIARHEKTKKEAYENILWALINSKAFVFNQ
jgi:hypothetical protein